MQEHDDVLTFYKVIVGLIFNITCNDDEAK